MELEEVLVTHERKVKELYWMADPEKCKRLTMGTERPAYHLDRLAAAQTKALSKLSDVPQAEKWEARHTDYKCIKECLELFRSCSIDKDINKIRKGQISGFHRRDDDPGPSGRRARAATARCAVDGTVEIGDDREERRFSHAVLALQAPQAPFPVNSFGKSWRARNDPLPAAPGRAFRRVDQGSDFAPRTRVASRLRLVGAEA